ncbi:MAG: LysR family transcriptional regulator, partial [Hyphomicrobiales bacterium]|nr:LysR family transcriptional regulator [Hyphomicrobiales bacterium]
GVAIVPRFLVEDELASGALTIPINQPIESQQAYWLVYPEEKKDRPAVKAFRSWLLDQCA